MAPITYAPLQSESFSLQGTGILTLTNEQRTARMLSISTEKVRNGNGPSYYNFRTPEPESWWGYLQTVNRDFIIEQTALQFRRQSIYRWDSYELEPIEQLRCLIKDSTLLLYDVLVPLIFSQQAGVADLGDLAALLAGLPDSIKNQRDNWKLRNNQPRIVPANPVSGLYYEIDPNWICQVTITWQGYLEPCVNPAGLQPIPAPESPGKDQSGQNGGGGGGTRPPKPVPPGRSSDPGSDSPGPPPNNPGGPSSPSTGDPLALPPRGRYIATVQINGFQSGSAPCIPIAGPPPTIPYDVNPGPALLEKIIDPAGGYIWKIFDADAVFIANISGASFRSDCETEVVIISQVRQDL